MSEEVKEAQEDVKDEIKEEINEEENKEELRDEEEKLTPEQLAEIQEKAKKYDDLLPDYTRKSQKLSELRKRDLDKPANPIKSPSLDETIKDLAEKEGYSEDELRATTKIIDKILPQMGYVPKSELEKSTYKNIQNEAVDDFLEKNPEFDSDEKWTELMDEFSLYKLPATKKGISRVLERCKKEITGENESNTEVKILARQKKNQTASIGSGGSGASQTKKQTISEVQLQKLRESSDFTEQELKEMFNY